MVTISKKGSTFVEAAIIFPVIIITLVLIINYSIRNYSEIKTLTEEHNALRLQDINEDTIKKNECDFIRRLDCMLED